MGKVTANRSLFRSVYFCVTMAAGLSVMVMTPAMAESRNVRAVQVLEMTGLGVGLGGGRIVTSAQALEMIGG